MSWDQNYVIPSVENLLEKLIGKSSYDLLLNEFEKTGVRITRITEVILEDNDGWCQDAIGYKVELSNGKVYIPKLVKKYTANGNYGCDYYEWKEIKEKVKVEKVNEGEV